MSAPPDHEYELIDALAEVRRRYGLSASYQRAWAACVSGGFPARRHGRRWKVKDADLPLMAAALGHVAQASAA